MDFKNKYLVITLRTLLGLMFVFSGISGLLAGKSAENIPAPMVETMKVLWETGIFQMIKITEITAGFMLVVGFLPWLAAIFLAPVCVGIIVLNAMVSPAYLPLGIIVTLVTMYFGYVYWDKYKGLFQRR